MISTTIISLFIIEVILLKVYSDIAETLDGRSLTELIMLDLSAASDVIKHPILLKHLDDDDDD